MYVETIKNRSSPPAILLRESFRENGKVKKHTLANLSYRPRDKVDALSAVLLNRLRLPPEPSKQDIDGSPPQHPSNAKDRSPFRILRPWPHGHVKAVFRTLLNLEIDTIIAARRWRERDLVVGMIVARLRFPRSKLDATVRGETTAAWSKYWALRMPMKTRSMPLWIGSLGANKDSRNNS